jgi:5-formyltetrahydrofolate cyclo-ligase
MNQHIITQKKELRSKIKLLKSTYSQESLTNFSTTIFNRIHELPSFNNAVNILTYWSLNDEVNTQEWIKSISTIKNIYLPVVCGSKLIVKAFEGEDNMISVPPFGIKEPVGKVLTDFKKIDIIIVPGMAFDRQGNRMGRGKGFYDRFLPKTNALRIGVCFDFQLLHSVPTDEFDCKMNYIVTESEILSFIH